MTVIIQSKKTVSDLATVNTQIENATAAATAGIQAVQDSLNAHKSAYDSKVSELELAQSHAVTKAETELAELRTNIEARVEAQENKQEAERLALQTAFDDEKARVAGVESAVQDSLSALSSQQVADKAELVSSIATEKAALQANIDALAASSSSDSGALTSRVAELESKVGADLTATINTALDNAVVKQTLDDFLAKDTEVASAVAAAVAERTTVDTEIKAKFDLLVDTLFSGLTFEGVEKSSLKFGPPKIYLPDGSFVFSVSDIVLSDWKIHYEGKVQSPVLVVKRESHIVWIYTPDNWNFYLVVTDESTGAKTASGYNTPADMNNHTSLSDITNLWTYEDSSDIKTNMNYTVSRST